MSGHSKWSTIKRKKGAADAKRGQAFTRLIREIIIAAKSGGGDPDGNFRLRTAIEAAKTQNMPKENIDRAIKKGTGELEGGNYEEIIYEAYAPGGVALLIEVLTDNKNRTAADIRYILSKRGGVLTKTGSVAYLFENKGIFIFSKTGIDEDKLMEVALEAGAEDIKDEGDIWEVHCAPGDINFISDVFSQSRLTFRVEVIKIPSSIISVNNPVDASKAIKLIEALDECDDVQHVYANLDIDDQLLASIED